MGKSIFLGGACGGSTWRRDIAIPLLEAAGVSFHNPQLAPGAWTEGDEIEDMRAKAEAEVLLFVISEATRGVASVAEVAYLIASGRPLALCRPGSCEGGRGDRRSESRAHFPPDDGC